MPNPAILPPPQPGQAGDGWYSRGPWAPGSPTDRASMGKASFPATVVVLRRRGIRIPARELLTQAGMTSGRLVCRDDFTRPHWYASLFDDRLSVELLPRLLQVQLVRENAGVRLYRGTQVEEREQYPQGWLCAPTPERAAEILRELVYREANP